MPYATNTPLGNRGHSRTLTGMAFQHARRAFGALLVAALLAPNIAVATERGPVTNLPLPRYVSMKAAEGNVRRGPSGTHRVDWVFKRRNMPVQIVGEYGHWRRVVDRDGAGGWMHYSLLSGARTVIVETDMATLHKSPDAASDVRARAEAGVVARLNECHADWCHVTIGSAKGWIAASNIWGVSPAEDYED